MELIVLIVPLDEAREGMKLAAPVCHPENPDRQLLRAGFVLERAIIARMREMGVDFLYVEYPALESLDKHLAVYLSPARQAVYKEIKSSIARVQKQTRPAVNYADYCDATRGLIETLMTQGQNPIYLDQMSRQGADAVAHAAAVAHLSLLLGLKLEQYLIDQRSRLPANRAKDIVGLGVAGMLHDVGMASLPPAAATYCDPERPDEAQALLDWQGHAQAGYELIHNDVEATAAAAVYQHHQHFDGSGFPELRSTDGPRGTMSGTRIHIFARIILCANLYDRLCTPMRGDRRSNLQVHRLMQSKYASWFDPEIIRVLQTIAPPFPPGCRLQLSDGTQAVVVDVNPAKPMQPTVRLLGEDRWTVVGDPIDLSAAGAPQIAGAEEAASATPAAA